MNMSPADPKRVSYKARVKAALAFAGDEPTEAWNGLLILGLMLNGLDLIPYSADITPEDYWETAPPPRGFSEDWPLSWIAERDALYGEKDGHA